MTPSHFPARVAKADVMEPSRPQSAETQLALALPPELEQRIVALEASSGLERDFDAHSWLWMLILGVILPAVLIVVGLSQ